MNQFDHEVCYCIIMISRLEFEFPTDSDNVLQLHLNLCCKVALAGTVRNWDCGLTGTVRGSKGLWSWLARACWLGHDEGSSNGNGNARWSLLSFCSTLFCLICHVTAPAEAGV